MVANDGRHTTQETTGSSVREFSTALQVQVPSTGNLTDDVVRNGGAGS